MTSTRSAERRGLWPSLAALGASAVLFFFGTGFAPVAVLTWLAPIPVLWLAPRVSTRAALAVAFLAMLLSTANTWSFYPRSHDVPVPMGIGVCLGFSVTFLLAVWVFRALATRGRVLAGAALAAATWTAVLYLASVLSPMGIMGTLAGHQADAPVVLQLASALGPWGVEFVVFFVPATVAALLAPAVSRAARLRGGVVAAVVLALVLGGGALRLAGTDDGPARRVALVVHDPGGWGADVATPAGRNLVHDYADQLAALPAGTRIAVLPEGAFAVTDATLPELVLPLQDVARARGIDVVAGYVRKAGGKKYNTALTIPADGGAPVPYLKQHDTTSQLGTELVFPPSLGGRTGVMICMDVNFPGPARKYAAAGATTMLIPAADNRDNGRQHARTGLLRGVENGFGTAWAGRTGRLTIADGYGRVLADRQSGATPFTTVVADLPPGPGATLYTRLGDWFAWLCVAAALAGVVLAARRPRADQARIAAAAASPERTAPSR